MTIASLARMLIAHLENYDTQKHKQMFVRIGNRLIEVNHLYYDADDNLILEHI